MLHDDRWYIHLILRAVLTKIQIKIASNPHKKQKFYFNSVTDEFNSSPKYNTYNQSIKTLKATQIHWVVVPCSLEKCKERLSLWGSKKGSKRKKYGIKVLESNNDSVTLVINL